MREKHKTYLKIYNSYLLSKGYKEENTARRVSQVNKFLLFVEERNSKIEYTNLLDAKTYLNNRCRKFKKASIEDKRYILARFYDLLKSRNIVKENIFNRENIYGVKNTITGKLTREQEKILNEFINYEKNYGRRKKTADDLKHQVSWYFNYLNENNLHYLQVKVSDAENLQAFLLGLKDENGRVLYASATINNKIGFITYFYEYLVKKEMIMFNPFKEIKKTRKEKTLPRNILDEENLNKLLTAVKQKIKTGKDLCEKRRFYRNHVMAELMYSTGARINEIIKLTTDDFNLFTGTVKLLDSKTGKERTGFLNSYTVEILHIYFKFRKNIITGKSKTGLLFNGTEAVKKSFNKDMQLLSKELGLGDFKSHNLRHSFACHMLKAGCDIRYIQAFLGHTRLATTQIYTKIEKNDLKSVLDRFHPRRFKREVKGVKGVKG